VSDDRSETILGRRTIVSLPSDIGTQVASILPAGAIFGLAAISLHRPFRILGLDPGLMFSAASLSKLFIAAEVLRMVDAEELRLDDSVRIDPVNCVGDPNGLISRSRIDDLVGNTRVTVECLAEAMLSNSSNTAANVLIDLVSRESINDNVIRRFGWSGSEVTRKFLPRGLEPESYRDAPPTLTCAQHVAEFFLLLEKAELFGSFVSKEMIRRLENSRVDGSLSIGGQIFDSYYHKIGSLEVKGSKGPRRWQHDAGVARRGGRGVVLCALSCYLPEDEASYFPLADVQRIVFESLLEGVDDAVIDQLSAHHSSVSSASSIRADPASRSRVA
jgi:hypothetical protein